MLHPVVEACLFQRKLVYASWIRGVRVYTLIYAGAVTYMAFLNEISWDRLWLQRISYGSIKVHLAQVQGEQIIF